MTTLATLQRHGSVALITIDNPPVNAISHAVRVGLLQAVVEADDDAAIQAIVLHGAGRNFIAGADIRELDRPAQSPLLNDVLLRVEACRKPVVAALHGAVLGGGLETALASHFRCATDDVQLGFPEIKLGLLPGSGGTQRLPRLIGVQFALDLMTSGEPIDCTRAQALGLIDGTLGPSGVVESALEYARGLIAAKAAPRRLRDRAIPQVESADSEFFAAYRKALPRAPWRAESTTDRIVECVQAAVKLPFPLALARSRELFEECRRSSESAALRHLFLTERGSRAGGEAKAAGISHVAVIGAGTMGSGIAVSCATGGYDVTLIDLESKALEAGHERAMAAIGAAERKGKIAAAAAALARTRIGKSNALADASRADLVIEAVFENLAVKQDVFRKLDPLCKPSAVLATNTSTLDVDAIASVTGRPQSVLGMHFFSPAHIMRLVEVVRGAQTSEAALATTLAVVKRLGKIGVAVGNSFGFVGNRMLYAYGRENQLMQLEGVAPERIDRVLEEWGMAMGPNAVADLAGLDVGYRVRRERKDSPADPRYWRVADMLAEMGRHGQKTGEGFYRYENGSRERKPDPQVLELIRAEAKRLDVAQRQITDQEIIERCIFALVNEGARLLQEGIATCSADIDVIWVNGYGFPRMRGGPMFFADHVGLSKGLDIVRKYQLAQGSQYWTPAPLLEDLVSTGDSFGTLCAPGTGS
ncbi:MAG: 3-hydroxyacyl-CoA dehydrogenase NAD-binding domain-containing protein [Gammaproteobacteria bacterium]